MNVVKILTLLLLFGIIGCMADKNNHSHSLIDGKPAWFWNPGITGTIGGVGESGYHTNGPSAQRQLAMTRAIDEIARQKGVHVKSVQEINQHMTSSNTHATSNSTIDVYSVHTVEGVDLSVVLKEMWRDPSDGRMYVWVVENK